MERSRLVITQRAQLPTLLIYCQYLRVQTSDQGSFDKIVFTRVAIQEFWNRNETRTISSVSCPKGR